jgi:sialate O-acetylesterase
MELTMERVKEKYREIIEHSENPDIRQFLVPDDYDFKQTHQDFEDGSWQGANPQSILEFSAVAYFFARDLYEQYGVPIGIINAAVGGSPVEAWMSEESLKKFPDAYHELQTFKDDSLIARIEERDQQRIRKWYRELNQKDQGLAATPEWSQPDADASKWDQMNLPGYWADETQIGNVNGVLWFRKEIDVPKSMTGQTAALWMGRIVDQDSVFVNGKFTGTIGYQYPPRRYTVDSTLLKEGRNVITLRVINNTGKGGFVPDKPYYLATGGDTLDLKGPWKYRLGATMDPLESQTFIRWKPAGLYNRMITPLFDYTIKGVIWYQGESNTDNASEYEGRFSTMIKTWRQQWGQGNFPFLYVQLANFMETATKPSDSNWAELRQAQLNTLELPETGMAVTIDLGEWNDIHPLNKKDVGKRLALQARKVAYGEERVNVSGPLPVNTEFRQGHVMIEFENSDGGLVTDNGEQPGHFSISGDGEHFVWAKTEIEGESVRVWNDQVTEPVVVRYAWADNPESANLYNKNGLPASPFEIFKE